MFTLAGKVIERAFQALCDMGEEETLETAVAKVHGPEDTLLPQHAGEMDLNSLSEEALMELANYSNYGIQSEATCREKLENLRSFRQKHPGAGTDMAKANRAINALRARIKLLMMAQKSTKWVAQTEQHQQQQLQEQQQQQQQQLQRSAAAGTALSGGSRADYFTAYQTPKRLGQPQGKNSDRHARAMQQGQRGKVVVLDSIMQLAGKPQQTAQQPAAGRKPAPQPSRPASTGPQYSSGMPSLYGPPTQGQARQQQQQQQHQQRLENQLIYQQQPRAGPQLARRAQQQQQQQGGQFTQLQLAPSQPGAAAAVKPAYSWGTRDLRGSQQQGAVCDQCGKAPAKTQVVLGGVSMCQQCEREQRAMLDNAGSKGMKAAPLRQDKLPARPAGITARPAAAPRAAGARRRGKAQGSEDAPITIDSDDEQEQQQQGAGAAAAAAAAAAAGDVEHMTLSSDGEGPSGGGRRRRSSRISLLDPDPGTAARFAGLHIVYPSEGGKGAVVVTPDDLARLDSGEFLNDTIIDFYTKWVELQLASSSPQAAGRFHFFNSFFYKKLSEAGSEPKGRSPGRPELARRAHGRVKTWTKGVDIFAKDFLLVPIHDALHWSLAIVCHPALFAQRLQQAAEQAAVPAAEAAGAAALARAAGGGGAAEPAAAAAGAAAGAAAAAGGTGVEAQPVIIHLDSMAGGHTTATIVNYLRYFLVQEWLAQQRRARAAAAAAAAAEGAATAGKESSPAPEQQPELQEPANAFEAKLLPSCKVSALPRQDNHCDCGLFVLAYLEYFVHADPPALSPEAVRNAKVELSPVEPRLMREGWFHPEVAYCLRDHLRHMLLDLMLQQAPDKELPGAVAAVADTAKYSEQLEVQRKDVEERGSEVNPVFGYVPPSEYARVRQQLAQYQQRQEEAKAARKAAAAAEKRKSGAERKRDALRQQQQQPEQQQQWLEQQQQHDAAAGHGGEPGAGGLFAVDYTSLDEQPLAAQAVPQGQQHTPAAQQQQQQQHRPQHIVFSVSDDEQGNDAVAASPAARAAAAEGSAAAGGTPAAGGGCRPGSAAAAPGWQGDDGDDDDFVEPRSKRRSGGGQQQHAKRIKPSQQQQQHGQQRQHALHPEQEDDPVLGDEQQLQQQQQQGQRPSRRLRSTEEVREQRRQRSLPPDDAGGSGVSSDSSGSLGRAGGAVAARRQEQQQQWRQPTPTPPPAAADEDEAEDMSVDEPPLQKQVGPAAAGPAAERDAQPAACTPHTRAAAAAADTVDLCSDDEDDAQPPQHSSKRPRTAQQQQQQVSDPEWESCEGGDDAAQHAEPSPQPAAPPLPQQQQQQHSRQQGHQQQGAKHPDEEALALLLPCHHADPSSMEQLWKMLGGEFEHYGADLVRMVRSGAVTAQDRVKMLDMLKEELGRRPPKRLLPYLLEKVQLLAVDATAQAADAARTEAAWQQLGLKQPQPQPAAAAKRPGSSGKMGSSRTGSAAKRGSRSRAAPDAAAGGGGGRGQRKLREVLPQGATLDFAGTVDPRIIASSVAKLVVRSREEHAGSGSDCAGGSSEHGGSSEAGGCSEQGGPPAELGDLRLGSQDEAADAAGGSSVLALLPQQQQQQQADVEVVDFTNDSDVEEQQQQPVAPSPWPVTGAAAQQAQRASAAAQQPLVRGQVADMLGSDDGDHPAGVASWQQQQHRSRHEQQQQQQQQNPWQQQQQQQLMRQLTNATAVGFSPALQEFWNGPGMQAGQMPASITAAGRQQQQQPAPLSPNVMPYGASDSVAGDSRQLRQDSGPTEELATGATDEHEDDAAADPDWRGVHEEDITSPARPAPPLAATAAAPPLPLLPAGAGGVTAHGSSSQQHTAAAAALLASPMRATRSSCPQQRAPAAGRLPQEYPALA